MADAAALQPGDTKVTIRELWAGAHELRLYRKTAEGRGSPLCEPIPVRLTVSSNELDAHPTWLPGAIPTEQHHQPRLDSTSTHEAPGRPK